MFKLSRKNESVDLTDHDVHLFNAFFKKNGFLNVRPVLYSDLKSLLNSKKNNLPLGMLFNTSEYVSEVKWSWDSDIEVSITQLIGVFSIYLYHLNCQLNSGKKVIPLEKTGKTVLKWGHLKVFESIAFLENQTLVSELNFNLDDIRTIDSFVFDSTEIKTNADKTTSATYQDANIFLRNQSDFPTWIKRLMFDDVVSSVSQKTAKISDWIKLSKLFTFLDRPNIAAPSPESFAKVYENYLHKFFSKDKVFDVVISKFSKSNLAYYDLVSDFMGRRFVQDIAQADFDKWFSSWPQDFRSKGKSVEYDTGYLYFLKLQQFLFKKYEDNFNFYKVSCLIVSRTSGAKALSDFKKSWRKTDIGSYVNV